MRKTVFTYPGSDFDRAQTLIALLGSFWARIYTGVDQLNSYVSSTAHTANQTYKNLLETVAAISRYDVPLFHTETVQPLVLKLSELNGARVAIDRFDFNTEQFDGDTRFNVVSTKNTFAFPAPDKLQDIGHIFNRLTFPTAALQCNIDFFIDRTRNAIVFKDNPFDNPVFLRRVAQTNTGADEELTLWCFSAKFDYDYVYEQFAHAIGLKLRTSQGYKELTNAIFTSLIDGGISVAALDTAISAICGIPITTELEERVEIITYDNDGLLIVTDHNVYRFSAEAVPRVAEGQIVRAGTQLIRGVEINEFFVGNAYTNLIANEQQQGVLICRPPTNTLLADNEWEILTTELEDDILLNPNTTTCRRVNNELSALALDGGFLSACFYGDLVFENKQVPLVIDVNHPSGYTYVSFELGGYPADVTRFFDDVHARGVAAAIAAQAPCPPNTRRRGTLAHYLDKRKQPAGEPQPTHLPATINPLQFLIENVLRNNVFVVRIVVSALGQNQIGLYNVRQLQQLLPPQTAMIVVFELDAQRDGMIGNTIIDSDDLTTFTGMSPQIDSIIPCTNDIEDFSVPCVKDYGATAKSVSGTCQ